MAVCRRYGKRLTPAECESISAFRRSGRGLLVTRDHMDLGSSVCNLEGVGLAHQFHTKNLDSRFPLLRDDPYTLNIDWPNFHSGANGDFQQVEVVGEVHPVLVDESPRPGSSDYLPSHPHEGAVRVPEGEHARIITAGHSKVTGGASTWRWHSRRQRARGVRLPRAASITLSITTGIPGWDAPAS